MSKHTLVAVVSIEADGDALEKAGLVGSVLISCIEGLTIEKLFEMPEKEKGLASDDTNP